MDIRMLIGGEEVGAAAGGIFERKNPFTGEVASRAPSGGVADAKRAVEAAAAAFESWAAIGPNERRTYLLKAAEVLASKAAEFGTIVAEETGATAPWGGFNVMLASQMLRRSGFDDDADHGRSHPFRQAGHDGPRYSSTLRRCARYSTLERPGHPRRARDRHAARLRQYGGAKSLRALPGDA